MLKEGLYTPDCIRTYSGQYINICQPRPEQIMPIDIAMGLARECRFGNHTRKFYSVAEHSVWCMLKGQELYPNDTALHFRLLLHDAHEAYMGDWCTPMVDAMNGLYPGIKAAVGVIKKILQTAINTRFGIGQNPMDCPLVHEIDRLALEWEWNNRVHSFGGMAFGGDDQAAADYWLDYFKLLVKVPVVIGVAA